MILENDSVVSRQNGWLRILKTGSLYSRVWFLNLRSDFSVQQDQTTFLSRRWFKTRIREGIVFLFSKVNSFPIPLKHQETKNRRTFGSQLILGMLLQRKAVRDAHVNEILHAYRFALSARTSKVEFDIGLCDWYYKFTRRRIYFSSFFFISCRRRSMKKIVINLN